MFASFIHSKFDGTLSIDGIQNVQKKFTNPFEDNLFWNSTYSLFIDFQVLRISVRALITDDNEHFLINIYWNFWAFIVRIWYILWFKYITININAMMDEFQRICLASEFIESHRTKLGFDKFVKSLTGSLWVIQIYIEIHSIAFYSWNWDRNSQNCNFFLCEKVNAIRSLPIRELNFGNWNLSHTDGLSLRVSNNV